MKQKNASLKAFTLVEMFVVVVILSILGIIGFFAFSSYVSSARDSSRNTTLTEISNSLNTFAASETLPVPDDSIRIEASGSLIGYQGYVGTGVKNEIHFVDDAIDPKLKMPYSYYLSVDKKKIQLLGFFEKPVANADLNFFPKSYAAGFYESFYPKIYGDKLGILLSSDSGSMNTPVQEISALKSAGKLDVVTTNSGFTALIDIDEKITGTGAKISQILPNGSCKRIKEVYGGNKSGMYTINPRGIGNIQVYCDMETDGGGWTAITRINPSIHNSYYWDTNAGTIDTDNFYNYMNLSKKFTVNEIYVSKSEGWDGSEYVFEKVGNDLYSRRGVLKDVIIKQNWGGLRISLWDWIGFAYNRYDQSNPFIYGGTNYSYIGHNNVNPNGGGLGIPRYDFPFYHSAGFGNTDNYALSNSGWGGANFTGNITVSIFIR